VSGGDHLRFERVVESVGRGFFHVDVVAGALRRHVIAKLSGKMATKRIRIVAGDRVEVEVSPYDLNRGRITYRRDAR
jgi:translation initiation factor IF-1